MEENEILMEFETSQTQVIVYNPHVQLMGEDVYIIRSISKRDGYELIRFGNAVQINSLTSTHYNVMGGKREII